ncbi:hypothetical protein [Burkholderia sp. Bp9012]|uniref:hypothetical protein n=1 Tax=Burkholderia sp. Bp9012 TaxID=2184562 RepID=UPI00162910B7|nr:hypothetical protein [Burkholderia sp. Bp9012]
MNHTNERVLAHQLARVLTTEEYAVVAGGSATGTTISSGGNTCHDQDDSSGTVTQCK